MPVPTIFLIDNNNQITEMKGQRYESEERLQNFLAMFPSVLAGDQMSGSAPLKWLLIKREAGIPGEDGGVERWSVDHLFVDQNGIPTIVEVKRSTDTRIRREVVGQMLDYAANAVQYWPIKAVRQWFEETCEEGVDPNTQLAKTLGLTDASDEAVTRFWETVETNLRAGRVRLIFAADEIPPELRRIIEFLGEQMTPAEVLGIEIRQYVGKEVHTLVPSVIRSNRLSPPSSTAKPIRWNHDLFMTALLDRQGAEAVSIAKRILDWADQNDLNILWGQGTKDGSCNLYIGADTTYHPFVLWTYGKIEIGFQVLQQHEVSANLIEELASDLRAIPGTNIPLDVLNKYPTFEMSVLKEKERMNQFLQIITAFVYRINAEKAIPATI